jgi:hypothetical protein
VRRAMKCVMAGMVWLAPPEFKIIFWEVDRAVPKGRYATSIDERGTTLFFGTTKHSRYQVAKFRQVFLTTFLLQLTLQASTTVLT